MLAENRLVQIHGDPGTESTLACSVGVMAYNEEANIGQCLQGLFDQETSHCRIEEIVVVASGCTDNTVPIARKFCDREPRAKLLIQPRREGKASAINLFLRHVRSDILVLESADTVPLPGTIERLVEPFADPNVGMTGGHPVPVNDPATFMGFVVHALWELHHQVALQQPKLGEVVAFRRVFHRIPYDSAVDEANIEPLIVGQGYQLRYVPQAIIYNRGAETVSDFIRQRRRIYAGHLTISHKQGYAVSTMSVTRLLTALLRTWRWDSCHVRLMPAVVGLEIYGRFLGWVDFRFKRRDHAIWDIAVTTKGAVLDSSALEDPALHTQPAMGLAQDAADQSHANPFAPV